ncbi:protein of unknown function [Paraburkholderia dioscoreae]|uniref:Uncharacterized protein n=1 Tax=Paraburkholderia dioscoreae TaxID=2604047 RepID=A0A5Q4YU09_9BURK|nr:protein of unknown function [Paraburkholderia dioscoreae]
MTNVYSNLPQSFGLARSSDSLHPYISLQLHSDSNNANSPGSPACRHPKHPVSPTCRKRLSGSGSCVPTPGSTMCCGSRSTTSNASSTHRCPRRR